MRCTRRGSNRGGKSHTQASSRLHPKVFRLQSLILLAGICLASLPFELSRCSPSIVLVVFLASLIVTACGLLGAEGDSKRDGISPLHHLASGLISVVLLYFQRIFPVAWTLLYQNWLRLWLLYSRGQVSRNITSSLSSVGTSPKSTLVPNVLPTLNAYELVH